MPNDDEEPRSSSHSLPRLFPLPPPLCSSFDLLDTTSDNLGTEWEAVLHSEQDIPGNVQHSLVVVASPASNTAPWTP
ncbi:hypothetical protein DFP72DRAFT_1067813 [Ephemerocybe angulata]|uniref:Uncharacterized protein n=1 Tax=Ephemerocybe angulata TaxID=980116 RepID=A0A8H6M8I1_9AGAR|nr:hypothetical protein DFP72DRAFT_1067813 [Tulosesus angulatus]